MTMQISVPLNANGQLADRFGKYAPAADMLAGHPVRSFPIEVQDLPAGTKALALTLIDYDATPVAGFPWIHWLATNLPAVTLIPENVSRDPGALSLIQGHNSNAGALVHGDPAIATGYVGPQPPNAVHDYTLTVFALDQLLALTDGYWLNEFYRAAKDHTLATARLNLPSRN